MILRAGTPVFESGVEDDIELCTHVLHSAGIFSVVFRPSAKLDLRLPQVRVAPDDSERAKELLAKPVDERVRAEYDELSSTVIPLPVCKYCFSAELLLEATEPELRWRFESCGASWGDEPFGSE